MALEYLLTKHQRGVSKAPPLYRGQDLTLLLELITSEFKKRSLAGASALPRHPSFPSSAPKWSRANANLTNPMQGRSILVIDGPSASGKSFLGEALAMWLDCPLVRMDHFFLPTELRIPERFNERGGNIHYERFIKDILEPALASRKAFSYRPWDCSEMRYGDPLELEASPYLVIEGVYALHPSFGDPWALSLMLSLNPDLQRQRIVDRETPEKTQRYFKEWLPLEASYFNDPKLHERVDLRLKTNLIEEPVIGNT